MNKRTTAELRTPSVYCQQRSNRQAQEGEAGGGQSEAVSGRDATMVNNGAIVEEFALMVAQSHHRGRVMDHLQRAGLSAARCHVHSSIHRPTGSRVAATCAPLPTPVCCVHAALLTSPAVREDRKSRPAARYPSSPDDSGGRMFRGITLSLVKRAWALGFLSPWRRYILSRVYAGCAARAVTWVD